MPSDVAAEARVDLVDRVLEALDAPICEFHRAVVAAERELRDHVLHRLDVGATKEEQALAELGPFASGRIDPKRFAMLLGDAGAELAPEAVDVIHRADSVLRAFAESMETHRIRVEPGGDLRDAVKDALADIGRLFGASRAVELARAGAFDPNEHGYLLSPFSFRLWNRAERHLAPPIAVELRGEDCLATGLGEFLDGSVKVVLVARGPTSPAPLARLVTPGTFVLQTADPDEIGRLSSAPHPGVALLFDQTRPEQAHFIHDPEAGDTPWERLSISQLPEETQVGRGRRAPVWLEDLVHLRSLAERPARALAAAAANADQTEKAEAHPDGVATTKPADQLAGWLLAQTDLTGL